MIEDLKRKIADTLELPQDIVLNVPRIIVTGKFALFVENNKGIIEYSSNLVKINTSIGAVCIRGNSLIIKTIIADEITIEGKISSIVFEE